MKHKILQALNEMSPVFQTWSKIIPLFRASCLLSCSEHESLINEIKNFEDAIKSIDVSITIKMHHLIHHADNISIDICHTTRYFAEDLLESIHALVNKFCSLFFQIDGTLRGKKIFVICN